MRIDSPNTLDALKNAFIDSRVESRQNAGQLSARKLASAYSGTDKYAGTGVTVSYQNRQEGTSFSKTDVEAVGDYSRLARKAAAAPQSAAATMIMAAEQASSSQASAQPIRTDQTGKVRMVEREYGLTTRSTSTAQAASPKSTFHITA